MGQILLGVALIGGPPVLPPVPGEQPPPDEDVPLDPVDRPQKPKPAPAAKPKAAPAQPAPTPSPAPEPDPEPAPGDEGWSIPQADDPPQPDAGGPPPEDAPTGDAPPKGDEPARPLDAPGLPGDELDEPRFRMPPPERPPYKGTGLFIGAGVTFGIALAEQIVGHVLVKRNCIDPIGRGEFEEAQDVGDIFASCAPGVLPAVALRLHSDLSLLATIGLVSAGAILRGQRDAFDDVFSTPKPRKLRGLRLGGISLIGAGLVTWFVSGAAAWGVLGKCKTARCANASRAVAFSMRDVSAIMVASGAGMLGYAEAVRRHTSRYTRDKAMSAGPVLGRNFFGFTLRSRF